MENIIEISNLDTSFGEVHAVNDLSFHVQRGELFAFLGVNGAGKSTTISIMCGTLAKDKGKVIIDGLDIDHDIAKISRELGVVFQTSVLDNKLTVLDNLLSRASLYGIYGKEAKTRINELAEILDFSNLLGRVVGKLSGGQKRRIDVARALIHRPKILILDEPTTGLDPQTRQTLWHVIENLRKSENMTVFLTTHYMEESADADYVVILDSGKISAEGTPLELKNKYTGDYITLYNADQTHLVELGFSVQKVSDSVCRIEVKNTQEARDLIASHKDLFVDFEVTKGKMDDVFLAVTGKKLLGEAK